MEGFLETLHRSPIIGALRASSFHTMDETDFSLCQVFFLLESNILELKDILPKFVKVPYFLLHIDLFGGIASDESGLIFIRETFPLVKGIISTRTRTLLLAKKAGFISIFRLFCIDSESLKTGLRVVKDVAPDAVELLPGVIFPKIKSFIPEDALPPIICGGFIREIDEAREILESGAVGISTSAKKLWQMNHTKW
ncbi:MAG: glycerol-3-phosphate responsive antiterminator [Candidatus Atribacteria bacterium]|nr:glycerol-3-phosphate responsive antiterminator [Candidatus Atribacteria bacterium]